MLIPRSTIRHEFRNPTMTFGERRMIFGFKESLSGAGASIVSGFGKAKTGIKWATMPARMVMWPVTKPISLAYKGLKGFSRIAKTPFYTAKHVAKGVLWETGAKSVWELAKAPIMDIKINLIDQFRTVTKGVFSLPVDIVKSPFRFFRKAKESVKKTRSAIAGVFKGIWNLKPVEALKSAKDVFVEPLKMPFSASWAAVGPMTIPFREIGKNAWNSKMQYPKALNNFQKQVRKGVQYIIGAHGYAERELDQGEADKAKVGTDADEKKKGLEEAAKKKQGAEAKAKAVKPNEKKKGKPKEEKKPEAEESAEAL